VRDVTADSAYTGLVLFNHVGHIMCVLHNMLAQLGNSWERMFLEGDIPENEDEINAIPMDPNNARENFRENLKKTTLETNHQHGVI
jgi:hypothetical protein